MYVGVIRKVVVDRGFCFISVPNMADVFAHVNDFAPELEWDEQLTERRVEFDLVSSGGSKGPRAAKVRAAV